MDNFNLKQFLFENKIGMYSKASIEEVDPAALGVGQAEADAEMQMQDDENGDMVDNVSMGTVAEAAKNTTVDLKEESFYILGKEYILDGEVDVDVEYEKPEYSDEYQTSGGGYVVTKAHIEIKELHVEEGDSYRQINDPNAIKQVQDLLNTDRKLNNELKDTVEKKIDFGSIEEESQEEQIGVGYVMKTKPADPFQREKF